MPTILKQTCSQQDQVHLKTHVEAFHQSCTVGRKEEISYIVTTQLPERIVTRLRFSLQTKECTAVAGSRSSVSSWGAA